VIFRVYVYLPEGISPVFIRWNRRGISGIPDVFDEWNPPRSHAHADLTNVPGATSGPQGPWIQGWIPGQLDLAFLSEIWKIPSEICSEKNTKNDLKIGWSLKILHQLISGKHKVNIPVGFNMFCFSQGGARISYPSTVYCICQGAKNQKPWPPTSSINWLHWIPYGTKIWSGLSYMAQKTGHQIHPNPMMCPHDARLRWRLDLTCGSLVKYDPWGFKYGSHPWGILKMLKSQKIPALW